MLLTKLAGAGNGREGSVEEDTQISPTLGLQAVVTYVTVVEATVKGRCVTFTVDVTMFGQAAVASTGTVLAGLLTSDRDVEERGQCPASCSRPMIVCSNLR